MTNQYFWLGVLQNFLGNAFSDIVFGVLIAFFITFFITKFFELLSDNKATRGSLILLEAEIQLNKHILEDLLHEMIPAYEKSIKRGTPQQLPLRPKDFEDAAKFMRIPAESLVFDSFHSSYSALGNLKNIELLEKILNLYTVGYNYRIITSFKMEQLNLDLLDSMKSRLATEIKNSDEVVKQIVKEVKIIKKRNLVIESVKEILKDLKIQFPFC